MPTFCPNLSTHCSWYQIWIFNINPYRYEHPWNTYWKIPTKWPFFFPYLFLWLSSCVKNSPCNPLTKLQWQPWSCNSPQQVTGSHSCWPPGSSRRVRKGFCSYQSACCGPAPRFRPAEWAVCQKLTTLPTHSPHLIPVIVRNESEQDTLLTIIADLRTYQCIISEQFVTSQPVSENKANLLSFNFG